MRMRAQLHARVEDGFEVTGEAVADGAVFEWEIKSGFACIVAVILGEGGGAAMVVEGPGGKDVRRICGCYRCC